jgi:hypothetical protein
MLEGSTLGTLVELMVRAEILAGSDGRLIPSRFEPDVDHRDLIVADVGGYGAIWLQVKGTTHLDREGRVVAFANYGTESIPEKRPAALPGVPSRPPSAPARETVARSFRRLQLARIPRTLIAS